MEDDFSTRLLSMLPWNQGKTQAASNRAVLQDGACIQQIEVLRSAEHDCKRPAVLFSVLDRYGVLQIWKCSLVEADANPMDT
jgi:hypothetical protein